MHIEKIGDGITMIQAGPEDDTSDDAFWETLEELFGQEADAHLDLYNEGPDDDFRTPAQRAVGVACGFHAPTRASIQRWPDLGMTPEAAELLVEMAASQPMALRDILTGMLDRLAVNDWGDVDGHDKGLNDQALVDGTRIVARYVVGSHIFWIIAESTED